MTIKKTLLLLALSLIAAAPTWGQEARATIGGRVVDPQGALVPAAQVVVTSDDTGVKQTTITNSDGNWSVRFLIPGRYHFTVNAAGFKAAVSSRVELQTADN